MHVLTFHRRSRRPASFLSHMYIVYALDLKPISPANVILKYADDTTLLVPQNSPTSLEEEFSHILQWSSISKLSQHS